MAFHYKHDEMKSYFKKKIALIGSTENLMPNVINLSSQLESKNLSELEKAKKILKAKIICFNIFQFQVLCLLMIMTIQVNE